MLKYLALAILAACKVDPSTLEACGDHCRVFPEDLVAESVRPHLRETSPGFLCVPDRNVADGRYVPLACASLLNAEGRCLATCIPEVAPSAPILPSAGCWPGEVCAPCVNPLTGAATGACSIGADDAGAGR